MKSIICFLLLCSLMQPAGAQIQWQHCYGGTSYEECYAIRATFDGGYILAGIAGSNDGDVSGNHGATDFWVVKIAADGAIEWQKCYGGSSADGAFDIRQTTDSGYVVVGSTQSNDGDVSGNHGGKDMWVIKIATDGVLQWQKCLGGSGDQYATSVWQTSDGGFIVAGLGNGVHGNLDYQVIKLTTIGNIEWANTYGGTNKDMAWAVQQTYDGGYIVGGCSNSNNGDVTGHHGDTTTSDLWVLKLYSTGNIEWEKSLGGTEDDGGLTSGDRTALIQAADSGFLVGSNTYSNDGDVTGLIGTESGWVVKLSESGTIQWNKCVSVGAGAYINAVSQDQENGFLVAGSGYGARALFGKFFADGTIEWVNSYGGTSGWAYFFSVVSKGIDTGVAAGFTYSNNGDVSGNHGYEDFWVVKFGWPSGVKDVEKTRTLCFDPNPANTYLKITSSDVVKNIVVTNLVGQVVYAKDNMGTVTCELDTHDWLSGMYFVKVNGSAVGRFVKE